MSTTQAVLPLAVQMYTLRHLTDPLDQVLAQVAAIGYRGIETLGDHGMSADAFLDLLNKHGLQAVSTHVQLQTLEDNFDGVIAFNQAIGNSALTLPVPPKERPTDAASWQALGRRLDKLGARLADNGMQLLYHNHAWEMELIDGKRALDWMMESASSAHLQWEPDLAWVVRGGADPLAMLARYTGRCPRIHVKDLSPEGQNEEEKGFADVGHGTLDWAALLPAAKAAGGEWFIVEHDWPSDPLRTIRRSFDFLRDQLSR